MKKFVSDPATRGAGGLKTKGETTSTKKLLAHAGNAKYADKMGRKK